MSNGQEAQAIGRIEGVLGLLEKLFTEIRTDQKAAYGTTVELTTQVRALLDLDKRVRDLERRDSYMKGALAIIGALTGAIAGYMASFLGKKG